MAEKSFHWQGSLDGLCGHYAIVNALTICGELSYKKQQDILLLLWKKHKEIYEGTEYQDITRMLAFLRRSRLWPAEVAVEAPFARASAKKDIGKYFQQLFSEKCVQCAIIQIQRHCDDWDDHWIVVTNKSKRLRFIDSVCQDGDTVIVKNKSSLKMGRQANKRSSSTKWHLIKPRQVFVFKLAMETNGQ